MSSVKLSMFYDRTLPKGINEFLLIIAISLDQFGEVQCRESSCHATQQL
jgi:hypothetical protein